MTKLEAAFDALNVFAKDLERATRRKRKIDREQLMAAVKIGTVIINVVATYIPQLKIVAGILTGLSTSLPAALPERVEEKQDHQMNVTP